jgi:hypothetical protein
VVPVVRGLLFPILLQFELEPGVKTLINVVEYTFTQNVMAPPGSELTMMVPKLPMASDLKIGVLV